ncbi:hypothetical protein Aasi_1588 [Candidatus Amoebophilus asiaticus 5a2]|uniref:Zinc-ribbon 15 domain-containing protein n=1 Tax=Amoebophilus asiaticus (strain 5a2) TaxID=452471 RepID=C3L4J6_AMOA5|nr:hypothetical protein [Candidatus Amoebophilus asiaticus]ACP20914.1 hypothetical protein Aasi_1588 [Candidatus Amoebophilus asiaticus 5a2]
MRQQIAVEGPSCNACGNTKFVLHGIQRYGHIWWIPFIPTEKIFLLTCLNCHSTISNDKVENLAKGVNLSVFKTPILSYIGGLIMLCLIALYILTGVISFDGKANEKSKRKEMYEIRANKDLVQTGDFLILNDKKQFGYVLARVLKVNEKSIVVQFSNMIYRSKIELTSIVHNRQKVFEDSFYQSYYYETTLEELKVEFQLEEIIIRKDNPRVNLVDPKELK